MSTNYDQLVIGSAWADPATGEEITVRSPHDQSLVGRTPKASTIDVDRAVAAAREAFDHGPWPRMTPAERRELIEKFNVLHAARADEIAELVSAENGSPIWFTRWTQRSVPDRTRAWLHTSETFEWDRVLTDASGNRTIIAAEPLGVVAAVIPWNSPHSAATTKMIPALLAGNPVILKASPEVAIDALLLGGLFIEAGFPPGVVSVLPAERDVSEYLIGHPGVDKVTFTGSTGAGRTIASTAGQQLKRVTLELGGKSAAIVLPDADLDAVATGLRSASFGNNAEACVAHTRILAPVSRYEEVVAMLEKLVDSLKVGNPLNPDTYVGPIVRDSQWQKVRNYIQTGIDEGARLVAGGLKPFDDPALADGFYVRPTLFADVDNAMTIAQEEIFGPVIVVIPYDTEADAIRLANDSLYGLDGGVWTTDIAHGVEVARAVRTGVIHVNGAPRNDEAPFGGFKASGVGREHGPIGLAAYIEYKSIAAGPAPQAA